MGCVAVPSLLGIPVTEMKCGQIGVIIKWGSVDNENVGKVVQRYGNILIVLGEHSGLCFDQIFSTECKNYRVRLLYSGNTIKIENIILE